MAHSAHCREEAEAKADVRKVGHMGNFYANLLSKNVAYGGATASAAGAAGAEGGAAGSSRTAEQESAAAAAAAEREKDKAAAEKAAQLEKLDTYERLRLEAELARRAAQAAGVEPSAPGGSAELEGACQDEAVVFGIGSSGEYSCACCATWPGYHHLPCIAACRVCKLRLRFRSLLSADDDCPLPFLRCRRRGRRWAAAGRQLTGSTASCNAP